MGHDLLRNLRELIALDLEAGITFIPRPPAVPSSVQAPVKTAPVSSAEPRVPANVAVAPALPVPAKAATAVPPVVPAKVPTVVLPVWEPGSDPVVALQAVAGVIRECRGCGLHQQRSRTVPGEGHPRPDLLFIGEGPGYEEDQSGRPFVGPAGQLLDRMIQAMGFRREEVFIANIVKCRPPDNRVPEEDEAAACMPYLVRQVDILRPRVICTLGATPLKALTGDPRAGITRARGKPFIWRGYTVFPTFHPSYLLRNEGSKKPCWEDLKAVVAFLGRSLPSRKA